MNAYVWANSRINNLRMIDSFMRLVEFLGTAFIRNS